MAQKLNNCSSELYRDIAPREKRRGIAYMIAVWGFLIMLKIAQIPIEEKMKPIPKTTGTIAIFGTFFAESSVS